MSIREWWRRTTTTEGTAPVPVAASGVDLDEASQVEPQAAAAAPAGGLSLRRTPPRHRASRSR